MKKVNKVSKIKKVSKISKVKSFSGPTPRKVEAAAVAAAENSFRARPRSRMRLVIAFCGACIITAVIIIVASKSKSMMAGNFFGRQKLQETHFKTESAVIYADPYVTFASLSNGNKDRILLVDMRSEADYGRHRFKNTTNVHFPYESKDDDVKKFVNEVAKQASKFKSIVLLPYSGASTSGEVAAVALINKGAKNVSVLKSGWNELYNLPNLWIPEDKIGSIKLNELLEN